MEDLNLEEWYQKVDVSRMSRDFREQPWKRRIDKPNINDFKYLYEELNLPGYVICSYMGISQATLSRAVREFKLHKSREKIKEARRESAISKFGSPSPFGNPEIYEKGRQTCEDKYGTRNVQELEEIRQRIEKTNMERYGGKSAMCSKEVQEKSKQTNRERYGVDWVCTTQEIRERAAKTNLERYGAENVFASEEIKERIKNTIHKKYGEEYDSVMAVPKIKERLIKVFQDKYGVINPSQVPEFYEKVKKTNLERYGAENVLASEIGKNKTRKTFLKKYGVEYASQKDMKHKNNFNKEYWLKHFVKNNRFIVSACSEYHQIHYASVRRNLKIFGIDMPLKYQSMGELEIGQYLASHKIKVKHNDRTILRPQELDLVIPEYKLAIEFNGIMYHSVGNVFHNLHDRIDENYHFNKTAKALLKGYNLLHIDETEWLNNKTRTIWKGILDKLLERTQWVEDVRVTLIDLQTAISFLNENALEHNITDAEYCLGIMSSDFEELLAVTTVNKGKEHWEFSEYWEIPDIQIAEGFELCVAYFRALEPEGKIQVTVNPRYSAANRLMYLADFEYSHRTPPQYRYFKKGKGAARLKLEYPPTEKQAAKFLEHYDPNKSIEANLIDHQYNLMYDCGRLIYTSK